MGTHKSVVLMRVLTAAVAIALIALLAGAGSVWAYVLRNGEGDMVYSHVGYYFGYDCTGAREARVSFSMVIYGSSPDGGEVALTIDGGPGHVVYQVFTRLRAPDEVGKSITFTGSIRLGSTTFGRMTVVAWDYMALREHIAPYGHVGFAYYDYYNTWPDEPTLRCGTGGGGGGPL